METKLQAMDSNQIDAAVALERRLSGIEAELKRVSASFIELASEKKEQNGRVGKLELAFADMNQKAQAAANFAAGRSSMRKTDLAVVGTLFTIISTGVGILFKVFF